MSTDDLPIEHRIYAGVSSDGTTLLGAPVSHFGVLLLGPPQPQPGENTHVAVALRLHFVGPSDDNLPLTIVFDPEQVRKLHRDLTDALALLDS